MTRAAPSLVSFLGQTLADGWVEERDAILTRPTFDTDRCLMTGAAYRADGSLILASLRPAEIGHWRHVDPVTIAPARTMPDLDRMETAIFGGHFFNMWGHFLLETLSSASRAADLPQCPVVFAPFAKPAGDAEYLADWERFKPLLAAAGWGGRDLVLQTGAVRVGRLFVPERLSVYGQRGGEDGLGREMGDIYRTIRTGIAGGIAPARPVVACRPSWSERRHPAEEWLYELLEAAGCVLLNGVDMTSQDQVRVLAAASALIGFAGSNLHNAVFCHDRVPVLEIGDARSYTGGPDRRNPTQIGMCEVLDQPVIFIDSFHGCDGNPIPFSAPELFDVINSHLGIGAPPKDDFRRFWYGGEFPR